MTKIEDKTDKQRIITLEKENAKIRKKLKKVCERLDELEAEDDLFPPDLTPEEREQQEALDKWHRIGVWE